MISAIVIGIEGRLLIWLWWRWWKIKVDSTSKEFAWRTGGLVIGFLVYWGMSRRPFLSGLLIAMALMLSYFLVKLVREGKTKRVRHD